MATWSTPPTEPVGHVLTAADWNTYIRDNLQYLYDRLLLVVGTGTPPTMTPAAGTYLFLASFNQNSGTLAIKKDAVTQTSVSVSSGYGQGVALVWSGSTNGSNVWSATGGSGGVANFYALRVIA